MFKVYRNELRLDTARAVCDGLGLPKGRRFKMYLKFEELVDDKITNEEKRFKTYVHMIDKIKDYIEYRYPFLDLSDIGMDWTGDELEKACLKKYDEFILEINELGTRKITKVEKELK